MKITRRQLRRIIKEALSRQEMESLKDTVADAAFAKSSIRPTRVTVREDKNFQVQWETEIAFKVTLRDSMGQREQWQVVGNTETGRAQVVGRI